MFPRRSKQPPASAPPHPEDVGVSEEAATSDPDPVVTVDADETAQREGATSAEATEEHEEQHESWWLGPSDELPAGMNDKRWRRTRWAATTSTLREEWASTVSSSKAADARYSSPIELRFSLEHARWRIGVYVAELEALDRRMAAVQLAAVGRFAEGTRAAQMAERLLRRLAERQAAEADPSTAPPESYADAAELVAAYETAQSELGRLRNDVGRKRQAEAELESLLATAPQVEPVVDQAEAARSIAQLQAEFGDDVLLRHRQPLAAAVRRGEPYARLRQMLVTLESQPANLVGELLNA